MITKIKKIAKRTYAYQYYWCVRKTIRDRNLTPVAAVLQTRAFFCTPEDKVKQFENLMKKAAIENCGHGGFFYSIDEDSVAFNKFSVIENMPINYNLILHNSIEEILKEEKTNNNAISAQNIIVLETIKKYIDRVSKNDPNFKFLADILNNKALSLEDALQRILIINQMFWQTGHKLIGLGRLDKLLDSFPEYEDEEEVIKDFLRTLHEHYRYKSSVMPGDTGQIILLGGKEKDGSYFSNRLTYKFIKCLKELNLPDPKILLRVSEDMPDELLRCAAECIATGIGSPLLSNDDVIIEDLIDFGYSREDAFDYGVSACWEPLAIGKSLEQNNIWSIEYGLAIRNVIESVEFTKCKKFDDLLDLFKQHLSINVEEAIYIINSYRWERDPLFTLFTDGCLQKNTDIAEGGAKYNDYGMLSEGLSSAVNSLLNIKRHCFEKDEFSLSAVKECILSNYAGQEEIKKSFSANANGFGTEDEEAVDLTNEIIEYTVSLVKDYRNIFGGKVKFGLSSPNYVTKGKEIGATADGRLNGMPFDTHISRDNNSSPTEIINFASQLSFEGYSSNANVVDIAMQSNIINENTDKFVHFLRSIIKKGIFQIQFNVLSYKDLVDAKAHPERHENLIVRVWGFSAYFNDLPEEYKDRLIERAREMEKAS